MWGGGGVSSLKLVSKDEKKMKKIGEIYDFYLVFKNLTLHLAAYTSPMYANKNTVLPTFSLGKIWWPSPVPRENLSPGEEMS